MQRLVQDPLALEILDGRVLPGDVIRVDADAAAGRMKFERVEQQKIGGSRREVRWRPGARDKKA